MPNITSDYLETLDTRYERLLKENHREFFYDDEMRQCKAEKLLYEVLLIVGLRKTAEASVAYYHNAQDIKLNDETEEST